MDSSISRRRQEVAERDDNPPPSDPFEASRAWFEQLVVRLAGPDTDRRTHAELEDQLTVWSRALVRTLLQDSLDLRAVREPQLAEVQGADGVARRSVEHDHQRTLGTVFGQVQVRRMAYRNRAATNLYPADAVLNLPAEKHSHGLRRLAAIEASRGSFQDAAAAIERATGVRVGKRQVQALACAAAADVDDFYTAARPGPSPADDALVLQADGKGIVMRAEALRPATAKAAAAGSHKLTTRLSQGEKRNRKRMAEVGSVCDVGPVPRTAADIIATGQGGPASRPAGPVARGKWLTASVDHDIPHVIAAIFDEAERRDPDHLRAWVALVDGNTHQITQILAEADRRGVQVSVLVDIVRVLEYLAAPRSALLHPPLSGEGLAGRSLGLMAYLDSKEKGDNSTPANRRSRPGVWGGALGDPRDMAKAELLESQSPAGATHTPAGTTSETGAGPCGRSQRCLPQPSGARSDAQ